MSVKITQLEAENVKRIKAVRLTPAQNGLTIIGGDNGQGKTSVLDSIAWALGGKKFQPTNPKRDGSYTDPELKVTLSNGLIVERKGKNSELKVTDPTGKKSGQQILNGFIGEMALNLPKFMQASDSEKAKYLLKIIGVGDQLANLDREEETKYNARTAVGNLYRDKQRFADGLQSFPGEGTEEVSAMELIQRQQDILLTNAENARKRQMVDDIKKELDEAKKTKEQLQLQIDAVTKNMILRMHDLEMAQKDALDLVDESTEAIEKDLQQIDRKNQRIRENRRKADAQAEADKLKLQYQELSADINEIRRQRQELLEAAPLPLEGLSVDKGKIVYKGQTWDGMSGSEQLKVATAIVRALNPECGFVLMDKLEQMDTQTLKEFGAWLEAEGMQVIGTRVSKGDECSIIIEDGKVADQPVATTHEKGWEAAQW
ncbi:AAA family ATPase [Faecalibaculum rodentium]|uniref:AAA family ATPase n=1 Tax=Faecalibaculum rodentium TaxID=1702221 RepID=UPI0027303B12|nr:AAA family ATPase [Faecalibaculum rodentium]